LTRALRWGFGMNANLTTTTIHYSLLLTSSPSVL